MLPVFNPYIMVSIYSYLQAMTTELIWSECCGPDLVPLDSNGLRKSYKQHRTSILYVILALSPDFEEK